MLIIDNNSNKEISRPRSFFHVSEHPAGHSQAIGREKGITFIRHETGSDCSDAIKRAQSSRGIVIVFLFLRDVARGDRLPRDPRLRVRLPEQLTLAAMMRRL